MLGPGEPLAHLQPLGDVLTDNQQALSAKRNHLDVVSALGTGQGIVAAWGERGHPCWQRISHCDAPSILCRGVDHLDVAVLHHHQPGVDGVEDLTQAQRERIERRGALGQPPITLGDRRGHRR